MNSNEDLIQTFYAAFAKLEYKTMQNSYADEAIFNDPVFGILQGQQIRTMWKMLCTNATKFLLQFDKIKADD